MYTKATNLISFDVEQLSNGRQGPISQEYSARYDPTHGQYSRYISAVLQDSIH
jgi:hypothetical protein